MCFILALIFMTSFAIADISLSEPEEIYNLGDRLYIHADGLRGVETGNLNINLVCGNRTTNLVKIPARDFSSEEDQAYSTYKILGSGDLEIVNLTEILGECQIILSIGGQTALTKLFTISNKIFVSASTDKMSYDPSEGILVSIDARKANGDLLNGFVEATNATDFSKAIERGFVSETFSMGDTIEAGTYLLAIRAYDVGRDGVLNEGSAMVSFYINQVASSIITSLSDVEVTPGESFTIGAEVFDQSGKEIVGTVSVKVLSPKNEEIEILIPTGDFNTFEFPINATAGIWRVIASFDRIGEEREFEMIKSSKMEFNITEGVLEVTCVGNWECNGTVDVQIGNESLELELIMDLGEVRKFSLKAPQGEYDVSISGGGGSSINQHVLLTGSAISIKDFKEVGIFKGYSVIWIFLIIVLGSMGVVLFMRYRKTKTLGESGKINKTMDIVKGGISTVKNKVGAKVPPSIKTHVSSSLSEDKSMIDLTKSKIGSAESTLVLKGEKYPSAVVALSVKNYKKLSGNAKDTLIKVIEDVKKVRGLIDWRGDYIFVVFSPLVTKTYKNELLATKAGFKILQGLKDYNKKFKDKIEFNLGVHMGELIASKADGKLKYTSIGNTISLAKRIADSDSEKLLVSDDIQKKMLRDLKVIKVREIGKNQIYEVSGIKDREANEAKLKDLLKRMD